MNRYVSITTTGLIGFLLISGCSPSPIPMNNSVASNVSSQTENNTASPISSSNWKSTGGKSFLLQGKIVEINHQTPYLLIIHLDNVLYSGAVTPRPIFPEPVGSTVTVYFSEPFANQGSMEPKKSEEVILGVKQYTTGTGTTPFWGSDASRYFYKKNGNFYGQNGLQLGIAT